MRSLFAAITAVLVLATPAAADRSRILVAFAESRGLGGRKGSLTVSARGRTWVHRCPSNKTSTPAASCSALSPAVAVVDEAQGRAQASQRARARRRLPSAPP